jgi:hypothetical protein
MSAHHEPASAPVAAPHGDPPPGAGLVEQIVAATQNAGGLSQPLVGLCLDDRHPALAGRVLVRIQAGGREQELWLSTLAQLTVRRDDRVLVIQPGNWPEGLVVGVIDGLRAHPAQAHPVAALTLKADEMLEVCAHDGAPLVSIIPTAQGPVLRLAHRDQRLEIAGRLAIAADAIDLTASGGVRIQAGGDVAINGEQVTLN